MTSRLFKLRERVTKSSLVVFIPGLTLSDEALSLAQIYGGTGVLNLLSYSF
jgi:hypothetical protein